jgi:hypothetical protein
MADAGMPDTEKVSEQLNAIPPAHRRRMALAVTPVGAVLLVAGILAVSRPGIGWVLVGLLVALLALVLLGMAWGLWRSAALTEAAVAEQRLDEVLTAAAGAICGSAGSPSTGSPDGAGSPCGAGPMCGSDSTAAGCGAACLSRPARTGTS